VTTPRKAQNILEQIEEELGDNVVDMPELHAEVLERPGMGAGPLVRRGLFLVLGVAAIGAVFVAVEYPHWIPAVPALRLSLIGRGEGTEAPPAPTPAVSRPSPPPAPSAPPVESAMVTLSLTSTPVGASVSANGKVVGSTPLQLPWRRGEAVKLRFVRARHRPESRQVVPSADESISVVLKRSRR
jgi:hypothetical protein